MGPRLEEFVTRELLDLLEERLEQRIAGLQGLLDARHEMLVDSNKQTREELMSLRDQAATALEKIQALEQEVVVALGDTRHPGLLHRIENALDDLIKSSNDRLKVLEETKIPSDKRWAKIAGWGGGLTCAAVLVYKLLTLLFVAMRASK